MIIETPLQYKATDLQTERCQVDEVVTLGHWQFEYLKNCTSDDFDFIAELRDKLGIYSKRQANARDGTVSELADVCPRYDGRS